MNQSQKSNRSKHTLRQAQGERIWPVRGELVEPQSPGTPGFWDGFMDEPLEFITITLHASSPPSSSDQLGMPGNTGASSERILPQAVLDHEY
jgi:hypothetical protein